MAYPLGSSAELRGEKCLAVEASGRGAPIRDQLLGWSLPASTSTEGGLSSPQPRKALAQRPLTGGTVKRWAVTLGAEEGPSQERLGVGGLSTQQETQPLPAAPGQRQPPSQGLLPSVSAVAASALGPARAGVAPGEPLQPRPGLTLFNLKCSVYTTPWATRDPGAHHREGVLQRRVYFHFLLCCHF